MMSFSGLMARLERADRPDRRLDADIVTAILAPAGCSVDPIPSLDGWDIESIPDANGETTCWLEAPDVPHLTELLEDAIAFAKVVRPQDGAVILALALRGALAPSEAERLDDYTRRLARAVVAETIRAVAAEDLNAIVRAA